MSSRIHAAAMTPEMLLRECDVRRVRRSGPGGQRRNKVETAVVIRHRPTGVEAEANERRSQSENQKVATKRLRLNLALQQRCEVAREAVPSELWRSRLHNRRIGVDPSHTDFPALLAEALDVLFDREMNVSQAANDLQCSLSQLVKFFKREPRAFAMINRLRKERGQHEFK